MSPTIPPTKEKKEPSQNAPLENPETHITHEELSVALHDILGPVAMPESEKTRRMAGARLRQTSRSLKIVKDPTSPSSSALRKTKSFVDFTHSRSADITLGALDFLSSANQQNPQQNIPLEMHNQQEEIPNSENSQEDQKEKPPPGEPTKPSPLRIGMFDRSAFRNFHHLTKKKSRREAAATGPLKVIPAFTTDPPIEVPSIQIGHAPHPGINFLTPMPPRPKSTRPATANIIKPMGSPWRKNRVYTLQDPHVDPNERISRKLVRRDRHKLSPADPTFYYTQHTIESDSMSVLPSSTGIDPIVDYMTTAESNGNDECLFPASNSPVGNGKKENETLNAKDQEDESLNFLSPSFFTSDAFRRKKDRLPSVQNMSLVHDDHITSHYQNVFSDNITGSTYRHRRRALATAPYEGTISSTIWAGSRSGRSRTSIPFKRDTNSPSFWQIYCKVITCFVPPFTLSWFGMNTKSRQQAWREKIGLLSIIFLLTNFVGFFTFAFNAFVCGKPIPRVHYKNVPFDSTVVHGSLFNVTTIVKNSRRHYIKRRPRFLDIWKYAGGGDSSLLFQNVNGPCSEFITADVENHPTPMTVEGMFSHYYPCVLLNMNGSPRINPLQTRIIQRPSGLGFEAGGPVDPIEFCHLPNNSRNYLYRLSHEIDVYYHWSDLPKINNDIVVYLGEVIDLTRLQMLRSFNLSEPLRTLMNNAKAMRGQDISYLLSQTKESRQAGKCLVQIAKVGVIDTDTLGCIVSNIVLIISLTFIISIIVVKFLFALYFEWVLSWRLGANNDKSAAPLLSAAQTLRSAATGLSAFTNFDKAVYKYKQSRKATKIIMKNPATDGIQQHANEKGQLQSDVTFADSDDTQPTRPIKAINTMHSLNASVRLDLESLNESVGEKGLSDYYIHLNRSFSTLALSPTKSAVDVDNTGETLAQPAIPPRAKIRQPYVPRDLVKALTEDSLSLEPTPEEQKIKPEYDLTTPVNLFSKMMPTSMGKEFENTDWYKHMEPHTASLPDHLHTICLVTAYSESEEGLRSTLDSISLCDYPNTHKLIAVVCDGLIIGSGNSRSTPEIVVSMITDFLVPPDEVALMPYIAVAQGAKRYNLAKVYAGHYRYQGDNTEVDHPDPVPIICIVKCGDQWERDTPGIKSGNRGKRDSQVLLMAFLQKVMFNERMTDFEHVLYYTIWQLTKRDVMDYEAVLMVDADTRIRADSVRHMVSCLVKDPMIMGICGETQIANKSDSWVTMIQVFEYFISHHLTKSFESVFGGVTCLPGCFSMYRIKAPKGPRGYWVPILANPDVVERYAINSVETLHEKNLLLLGEDRYLSTLMLKTFPTRKQIFVPQAKCETIAPNEFRVLLDQRRRWINSTVHNLMELIIVRDLCGVFCISMQFVVFIEFIGTLTLPAALLFTFFVVARAIIEKPVPIIPLILLCLIVGIPGLLIVITAHNWAYVFWMFVYLVSLPIWNFILPLNACKFLPFVTDYP